MVRQKKTDKIVGRFSEDTMREAVNLVTSGMSIRQAASKTNLSFKTVSRYVKKYRDNPECLLLPNYKINQIFSSELEEALIDYVITCSKMFYIIITQLMLSYLC